MLRLVLWNRTSLSLKRGSRYLTFFRKFQRQSGSDQSDLDADVEYTPLQRFKPHSLILLDYCGQEFSRSKNIFDAENIHDSFHFMQKGQHIEKAVIKFSRYPRRLTHSSSR